MLDIIRAFIIIFSYEVNKGGDNNERQTVHVS